MLRVRDGASGRYRWVECGTCECGWQVPHYAESVGDDEIAAASYLSRRRFRS
jgi:hypothetical protein